MCGIVGVIVKQKNGFTQKEIDMFTQLLYADAVRGVDGTGIFYNSKKNKGHIKSLKGAFTSSLFINTKQFKEATTTFFNESNFIIGHNRSATRGKVNFDCTHPFKEQHINLVHNGTLTSHKELHDDKEVEVDSHAICHSIANKGAEETLKDINGAFALVWFDAKEKTLNMCRNTQRPLNIIETPTSWIICSELELGLWILKRNNVLVIKSEEIATETLIQFNIEDMTKMLSKKVQYKSWKQTDWHKYQNYSKYDDFDGYENYHNRAKRVYQYGDIIKFKGGTITKEHNSSFIRGDTLKFSSFAPEYPLVDSDFPNTWEIKVFGTEEELLKLALCKKLTGKVSRVVHMGNNITYILEDVKKYGEPAIIAIPDKTKSDVDDGTCEWCNKIREKDNHLYGSVICNDCMEEQLKSAYTH
jgi:hypothetical protein